MLQIICHQCVFRVIVLKYTLLFQYKSIAQVNESALKQIEAAHENFKVEVLGLYPFI